MNLIRSLPWIHDAADVVRSLIFIGFVLFGLRVVWVQRRGGSSRRAVLAFAAYSLAATCAVGFTQIEAWPFTTWALVNHVSQTDMVNWKLYGVDQSGQTYPIDVRFIEPMPYEELDTWMKFYMLRLGRTPDEAKVCLLNPGQTTPEQRRVTAFLLERAEKARSEFVRTGVAGNRGRYLGRFAAPYHFDRLRLWKAAGDVPASPFVGLQIWIEEWNVEGRNLDETRVKRRLLLEHRS
jgi:hypothetical protein